MKTNKYVLVFFIFITISTELLAYRPGFNDNCRHYQYDLLQKINNYSNKENITIKDTFPGKEFESLYNKLLEKKYINNQVRYPCKDCSYGITIISGTNTIYCKYHGNNENCKIFESMSAGKYYAYMNNYGTIVFIGCSFLALSISIFKSILKKTKKS